MKRYTSIASLLIKTRDYRGALANLDESKRILEHPGLSNVGTMQVYALVLKTAGEVNRALGNEPAACAQFSKASDLYDKISHSSFPLTELKKDLSACARR